LGSWFQRFQSTVLGSNNSGPTVKQNIMVEGICEKEGSSCHGRQEVEKDKKNPTRHRYKTFTITPKWPTFPNQVNQLVFPPPLSETFHIQTIIRFK
jgi:hypothetical protein